MKESNEKSKKISEIIAELEQWKKEHGDLEVFIANTDDACFDGFGRLFTIQTVENDQKYLGIIRSSVVLKF